MPALTSNHAKEAAAITWVLRLERAAGRKARDTRYRGAPGDIESDGRIIEVKAFGSPKSGRGDFLWLETRQVEEARRNPDHFYIYVVGNVSQGDPSEFTLRAFGGEQLRRIIARAKERHYFEVPMHGGEFDSAPTNVPAF